MADFKETGNLPVTKDLFLISHSVGNKYARNLLNNFTGSMSLSSLVDFIFLTIFEHSHTVTGESYIEAGLYVTKSKGLMLLVTRLLLRLCPTLEKYSVNALDKHKLSEV